MLDKGGFGWRLCLSDFRAVATGAGRIVAKGLEVSKALAIERINRTAKVIGRFLSTIRPTRKILSPFAGSIFLYLGKESRTSMELWFLEA